MYGSNGSDESWALTYATVRYANTGPRYPVTKKQFDRYRTNCGKISNVTVDEAWALRSDIAYIGLRYANIDPLNHEL